jgi:hypothetical protein
LNWRINGIGEFVDFGDDQRSIVYSGKQALTKDRIAKLNKESIDAEKKLDLIKIEEKTIGIEERTYQENIMLNSNSGKKLFLVSHIVNDYSTEEDLRALQRDALKAGVILKYDGVFKKGVIRNLNIQLTIITETGAKLYTNYYISKSKRESFSYPIIYRVDETGKAIDFGDPDRIKYK